MRSKARIRYLLIPALFLYLFLFSSACKKDNTNNSVEGKIVLSVKATHHTVPVPSLPVYLKYNTSDYPGRDSTKYNVRLLTNSNGEVNFTKLTPGTHYLYAYGYDSGVGENVIGYQPVTVSSSTIRNDSVLVQMFVSE
jgi:hypothetical protein